ncbi:MULTISPECIES: rhomboid family intramembrane serine protease [Rhizobium]|nr:MULTISPECIES: rhomboid family intramembrane serine protease [Rhizobium]MDV4157510.1 rhomboid family intramembrane serine protease [Rhizobium brockwellii]TAY88577.1 rhomboid family intramembrane serine protease [Rhizobium leguminosarum]TAY99381.1 rhomboid family intramembrane serine protease [Rhizobium leguminosarum]TAZ10253.1 rhomboid family intramembrane serine protease [Rhizobium leguminosarum]
MTSEELRRSEYAYNKRKLLLIFLVIVAITAGIIWLGFHPPGDKDPRVAWFFVVPGAAFFGILALLLLPKLFSVEPGLVMSTAGIRLPNFPGQILPWSAIQSIGRVQTKYADNIILHLDPTAARTLVRRGLTSRLPEWFLGSRAKVGVALKLLRGNSDRIFDEFVELLSEAYEAERQTMQEDGSTAPDDEDEALEPALNSGGHPIFTYILLATLIAVYAGELTFGLEPPVAGTPTNWTLFVLGGTFRQSIVEHGQWWRLFTAPFMHGGILHLAFNCVSLWFAGGLFERLIGWRWFAAIFFASALGGSVASVWINAPNTIGVGASGGIVGLFAAVIAASFRFRSGPIADTLRIGAAQILIPSLLPFLSAARGGENIDYAGHFGGALIGAALSSLLLAFWPRERPTPRFGAAATAFSTLFIIIAAASLWPISNTRQFIVNDPMANYFAGKYGQAATGFAIGTTENPPTAPYYHLWRFMAQSRGNDTKAIADLKIAASKTDQGTWPYPVFSLFLGDLKPDELMAKAADSNQRCEATFYNGEWYLLGGNTQEARRRFEAALSSCPTTYMEYDGAKGELNSLGVQ